MSYAQKRRTVAVAAVTLSLMLSSFAAAAGPAAPPAQTPAPPQPEWLATPATNASEFATLADRERALGQPPQAEKERAAQLELEREVVQAMLSREPAPAEFTVDPTLIDQKAADAGQLAPRPSSFPSNAGYISYEVSGSVVATDTKVGVSNVVVALYDGRGERLAIDVTDRMGAYSITYYPPGPGAVYAYVNPSGVYPYLYMPEWYDNQPGRGTATPIDVVSNTVISGIDFVLDPGGRIQGTVTAADTGAPLQGVRVYMIDDSGMAVDYVATDAAGQYTSGGLQTGAYRLYAVPEVGSALAADYVPTYYMNAPSLSAADRVSVTAPNLTTGATISLTRGAQITGVVTAEDTGLPLADVEVYLFNRVGDWIVRATTDAAGAYQLRGVPSGSYKLYFSTYFASGPLADYYGEYYNDKRSFYDADMVSVSAPGVLANVDAALGRDGRITGTVTALDTQAPMSGTAVYAQSADRGYEHETYFGLADGQGRYSINAPAGRYKVSFYPDRSGDEYCRQYYQGQLYAQNANIVHVKSMTVTPNVDARLSRAGRITGTVTAADTGQPLPYVMVYRENTLSYFDWGSAPTDASGRYTLTRICGGMNILWFEPTDVIRTRYAREFYNDSAVYAGATLLNVPLATTLPNIDAALEAAGQISGTVTAQDSGAALGGVVVDLYDSQGRLVAYQGADSAGRFVFAGLRPGAYKVRFAPSFGSIDALEYLPGYFDGKSDAASADLVSVAPGKVTSIVGKLQRGGQIQGTVNASGLPNSTTTVCLLDASGRCIAYDYAWYDGTYRLIAATGEYRLIALPQTSESNSWGSQYYSGKSDFASATVVSVTAPGVVSGVDFDLQAGGKIQGRVVDAVTGEGLQYAGVRVFDSTNPSLPLMFVYTDSAGNFSTRSGLGSGTYRIHVEAYSYVAQFYGGQPTFEQSEVVTVTAPAAATGVNFSMVPASALPVRRYLPALLR